MSFITYLVGAALLLLPAPTATADNGFVGCSNSQQSVEGYGLAGGNNFWGNVDRYGGGKIQLWADPNNFRWDEFDDQVALFGEPSAVWVQICARTGTVHQLHDAAVSTLEILRTHTDATVYVNGLHCYDPGFGSKTAWQNTIAAAEQIVNEGLALIGPVLPCAGAGDLTRDDVHLTTQGKLEQGQALLNFFGA